MTTDKKNELRAALNAKDRMNVWLQCDDLAKRTRELQNIYFEPRGFLGRSAWVAMMGSITCTLGAAAVELISHSGLGASLGMTGIDAMDAIPAATYAVAGVALGAYPPLKVTESVSRFIRDALDDDALKHMRDRMNQGADPFAKNLYGQLTKSEKLLLAALCDQMRRDQTIKTTEIGSMLAEVLAHAQKAGEPFADVIIAEINAYQNDYDPSDTSPKSELKQQSIKADNPSL